MATTTYFDHVIDPATGQSIEVCDKYAREQLVHKVEKTIVNSLPAKPTSYDAWTAMEPFLYWVPVDGQENDYQVWTLFFIGDPTDPSDYTDTDNYEWAQVADTDVDLSNFSTKGHTHEVIPETEVYDHEYTPQGTVSGSFTDASGTAAANGSHQHSVTVPSQNVTGTLSGTAGTTGAGSQHRHAIDLDAVNITGTLSGTTGTTGAGSQHRHGVTVPSVSVSGTLTGTEGTTSAGSSHTHSVTPTKKKMSTKKMSVAPATTVNFSGSTTNAQRATGVLETLGTYDPTKAVFNGFSVVDGGLVFTVKKMTTADTVSGLQASVDASKVTYDGNGTATNVDVATGGLTDGQSGDPLVMTDVSVQSESGHTHGFTPAGTVSGSTTSSTVNTEYESGHTHDFTPSGTVSGTTASITGNTGYENEHTHSFTPAGTVPITVAEQTVNTESNGSHTHDVSVSGEISATFQGMRANLKHKVDNKKVITSPDKEDPSSHVFDWYGIEFDEDGADPIKPRVGNMDMHKTLPIQSKMRRCLLNDDGTVNYYLDDRDSTKKAGSQEGWVTEDETSMSRVETDDIRDSNELVESIKGNSTAWNQLIKNGNFTDDSDWRGFNTVSDGIATGIATATGQAFSKNISQDGIKYTDGHVYLFFVDVKSNNAATSVYILPTSGAVDGASERIIADSWTKLTYRWDRQGTSTTLQLRGYNGSDPTQDVNFSVRNVMCFDLTLIFGKGNEPTTVEAFEAWLAQNVGQRDYYPYDEGSILNNTMKGVKTTFDGGSNTYPFDVTKIYGQLDGEGELVQVFPDGMKSAGGVKDILTAEQAVKNVGSVDLGTKTWNIQIGGTNLFRCTISDKVQLSGAGDSNLICSKYAVSPRLSNREADAEDNIICEIRTSNAGNDIFIADSGHDTAPTSHDNWIDGVILNYVLATPLIYTNLVYRDNGVDTPFSDMFFPNGINVGKNGTVEILPQNDTDVVTCAPTLTMKKYVLQTGAILDGSDGQVMVEIPEHWRMVRTYLNGSTTMVKAIISPYPQETAGWIHVKKGYISAYEASVIDNKLCSVSNIVGLTLALQDGKIVASCDVSTATGQSDITSQLPTTNQTMGTFRTAARSRNNGDTRWNQQVYEQYLAVVWLYWIEYANLNSQAPFTTALDINGYRQGGLGNGVTTINDSTWNTFNSRQPFIPCGITNCLGNHSGEVYLTLPSGLGGGTVAVPSYRGIENFFGHIWKQADGVLCDIESGAEGLSKFYVCDTPSNFSSSITSDYEYRGNLSRSSGYVKSLILGEYGEIMPLASGASSSTYFCDYFYTNIPSGSSVICAVVFGGIAINGARAGASCSSAYYSATYTNADIGSRLSFFEK